MIFDEAIARAESEFKKYLECKDRANLDGALEHLRNTDKALQTAIEEVSLRRKHISLEKTVKNIRK